MPPYNQETLDALLSKEVRLPIDLAQHAEPPRTPPYAPLFELQKNGLKFTLRSLFHAIGCKTARLSMREQEEAVHSAYLFTKVLDLRRNDIGISKDHLGYDSDLLGNRSNEIGIGVACLLAWEVWRAPWDQMEPIPGSKSRFDFRAKIGDLRAIFEAKGASNQATHKKQIEDGLRKKREHHKRSEHFDIELIIATHLASYGEGSRITVADPPFLVPEWAFTSFGDNFFAHRHWARVLNFIGDFATARMIYEISLEMLGGEARFQAGPRYWPHALDEVYIGERLFSGTWRRGIVGDSLDEHGVSAATRQKNQRTRTLVGRIDRHGPAISIFQGLDASVLETLRSGDIPATGFSPDRSVIRQSMTDSGVVASVFPDGTALAVRLERPE